MLILDLWGISFHAVVVFGLDKNLLFKSILGRCGYVFDRDTLVKVNCRIRYRGSGILKFVRGIRDLKYYLDYSYESYDHVMEEVVNLNFCFPAQTA